MIVIITIIALGSGMRSGLRKAKTMKYKLWQSMF